MDTNLGESFDIGDQNQNFNSEELSPLMAIQLQPNDYDASEFQMDNSVWFDQPSGTNNGQIMSDDFSQLSTSAWDNTANETQLSHFNQFSMGNAAWWTDDPALQPTGLAPSYQLPFDAGNQIYGFNNIRNPNLITFNNGYLGAEFSPTFNDHEALQMPEESQTDEAASPLRWAGATNHPPLLGNHIDDTALANIGSDIITARTGDNEPIRINGLTLNDSVGDPVSVCEEISGSYRPMTTPPEKGFWHCPWPSCAQVFEEEVDFTGHLQEHQYSLIRSCREPTKCSWPKCSSGRMFKDSNSLRIHLANIHVTPLRCVLPGCKYSKPFGKLFDLHRHVSTVHEKNQKYLCTFESCEESFPRKDKLVKHKRETHDHVICSLKDCGAKLLVTEKESHIQKAHGPYECALDECQKAPHSSLLSRTKLQAHLRKVHKLERNEFRNIFSYIWESGDNWDEIVFVVYCPANHCLLKMLHNESCLDWHGPYECRIGACAQTASSRFPRVRFQMHLRNQHMLTWEQVIAIEELLKSCTDKSVYKTTHPSCDPDTNAKLEDCKKCLKLLDGGN